MVIIDWQTLPALEPRPCHVGLRQSSSRQNNQLTSFCLRQADSGTARGGSCPLLSLDWTTVGATARVEVCRIVIFSVDVKLLYHIVSYFYIHLTASALNPATILACICLVRVQHSLIVTQPLSMVCPQLKGRWRTVVVNCLSCLVLSRTLWLIRCCSLPCKVDSVFFQRYFAFINIRTVSSVLIVVRSHTILT